MLSKIALPLLLLLRCVVSQETLTGQCSFKDLKIKTTDTKLVIGGKPAYLVSITNKCDCSQRDIIIDCTGFQSAANLNPADLNQTDEHQCKLNDGRYIDGQESAAFIYSWDKAYNFKPLSSTIACG